jgi:hypothetical protein
MKKLLKVASILDNSGDYILSDKLFKIAQEKLFENYKTFDFTDEFINKPTKKFITNPIKDYILKPVDQGIDYTMEGTKKLTDTVDKYTVQPALKATKFVDQKAKDIAKTPQKIKEKLNPPKDTDTFLSVKMEGTQIFKDYKTNILKYKELVGKNELLDADNFLDDVINSDVLTANQKTAFKAQAERIKNYYAVDDREAADEPLYTQDYIAKLLKKYKISLEDIKKENLSLNHFEKRWDKMLADLPAPENLSQRNFLKQTLDILKAHYGNSV